MVISSMRIIPPVLYVRQPSGHREQVAQDQADRVGEVIQVFRGQFLGLVGRVVANRFQPHGPFGEIGSDLPAVAKRLDAVVQTATLGEPPEGDVECLAVTKACSVDLPTGSALLGLKQYALNSRREVIGNVRRWRLGPHFLSDPSLSKRVGVLRHDRISSSRPREPNDRATEASPALRKHQGGVGMVDRVCLTDMHNLKRHIFCCAMGARSDQVRHG